MNSIKKSVCGCSAEYKLLFFLDVAFLVPFRNGYCEGFENNVTAHRKGIWNSMKIFMALKKRPTIFALPFSRAHEAEGTKSQQKLVTMMNTAARRAVSLASRRVNATREFSALVAQTEEFPG